MNLIKRIYLLPFLITCIAISCDIKKNKEVLPETSVKIYNNSNFSDTYSPIDIIQTESEEFIFLAKTRIPGSDFSGIYILKVDKDGNFISQYQLDAKYVNPVNSLISNNHNYYFFCMNSTSLNTVLMKVDVAAGRANEIASMEKTYPLAASSSASNGFILMNYDREELKTSVTETDISGNIQYTGSFETSFGDLDAEPMILDHLRGTGKTIPFFCGYADNRLYFNGIFRYRTSLSFFNKAENKNPAVIQGYQKDLSFNAYCASGSKIAVSKNEYGNIYFSPNASLLLNPGAISSVSDIKGYPMLDLIKDAKVVIKSVKINNKEHFVFGSETKDKQIILYIYERDSGVLKGTKTLGFTNPYEFGSFITTKNNGLAIAGTTYISNRFSRICLFLLSENDLKEIINPTVE